MLEALRTETARVEMSLLSYDEDRTVPVPIDPSGSKSLPPPHEFVYLQTRVTNLSASELVLTLTLSLEPAQHVLFQGTIRDVPIGRLAPGESQVADTPVVFVSGGRFDCSAEVHALGLAAPLSQVGRGQLRAVVNVEPT